MQRYFTQDEHASLAVLSAALAGADSAYWGAVAAAMLETNPDRMPQAFGMALGQMTALYADNKTRLDAARPLLLQPKKIDGPLEADKPELLRALRQHAGLSAEEYAGKMQQVGACLQLQIYNKMLAACGKQDNTVAAQHRQVFAELVATTRREAKAIQREAAAFGYNYATPYDALLDRYEPGMTSAALDMLFRAFEKPLPMLRQRAGSVQTPPPVDAEMLHDVVTHVVKGMGFTGTIQPHEGHPMCPLVHDDITIFGRFDTTRPLATVLDFMHEAGHGLYQQATAALNQETGGPLLSNLSRSMGLQEGVALFAEFTLGRDPHFLSFLHKAFAGYGWADYPLDSLIAYATQGDNNPLVRIDANQAAYGPHVWMRYTLERDLINGELDAGELPERYNALAERFFHQRPQHDYVDGAFQDIHWNVGWFGYFPAYGLGAVFARNMEQTLQESDRAFLREGNLTPALQHLTPLFSRGSRAPREAVLKAVLGPSGLDPVSAASAVLMHPLFL